VRDALIWAPPIPTAVEVIEAVPQPPPGTHVPSGAGTTITAPCGCRTAGLGGIGNVQYVLFSTTTIVAPLATETVVPSSLSVSWIVPDRGGGVVAVVGAVCPPTVVGVIATLDEVPGETVATLDEVPGETVVLVAVAAVVVVASVLVAVPAPHPVKATTTTPVASAAMSRRLSTVIGRVSVAAPNRWGRHLGNAPLCR
jgi:small basic protein